MACSSGDACAGSRQDHLARLRHSDEHVRDAAGGMAMLRRRAPGHKLLTDPFMTLGLLVLTGALVALAAPPNTDWKLPPTRDFPLAGGNYANWPEPSRDAIH